MRSLSLPSRPRAGLALIIVLGILGVFVVVAVCFVSLAQLERQASQRRIHATQALLLARSGLEDALARLASDQDTESTESRYGGEDWNDNAVLDGPETTAQIHHRTVAGTRPDRDSCPLPHALRPSFSVLERTPLPRRPFLRMIEALPRGFSGQLSAKSGSEPAYALKISWEGGFCLNAGNPGFRSDPTAVSDANTNHRRLLGLLAEALDREDGANDGIPLDETDGFALIDRRPMEGWSSVEQAFRQGLGGVGAKAEALREYVCLHAWADRRVIRPNATAAMVDKPYSSWGEIKLDHAPNPFDPTSRAPDFERAGGLPVGRPPIYLGWARRREPALVALFSGLRGLYLDELESTSFRGPPSDLIGHLRVAEIANAWSPADECHRTALALLQSTSDLSTWEGWNRFCDTLPFTGASDLVEAKRSLLKSNFNPNSDLNKFNPNNSLMRLIDKSDLLAHSTEFTLLPLGRRRIESLGRVLDSRGRLLAARRLQILLPAPSVLRLSTQREFVCEDLGSPAFAGDEAGVRLPGAPGFVSMSQGTLDARTWGHRIDMRTVYPGTWLDGEDSVNPCMGMALQSYPEPCWDPAPHAGGPPLAMSPADWDGNLQLATLETSRDAFYTVTATTQDMKLLARFDDGPDLDEHDGASSTAGCVLDSLMVGPSEIPSRRLLDAERPCTLYPDGCYSEKGRAPAFQDLGNADDYHGLLSFWFKTNFLYPGPPRGNCRSHPFVHRTWYKPAAESGDDITWYLAFYTGHTLGTSYVPMAAFHFEIGRDTTETNIEHGFAVRGLSRYLPHRWRLMTLYWDSQSATKADTCDLRVDGGAIAKYEFYPNGSRNIATSAFPLTPDGGTGPHLTALGRQNVAWDGWTLGYLGSGADATFDEFAIYDFGGAGTGGVDPNPPGALPKTYAAQRHQMGRYYKGSVYRAPDNPVAPAEEAGSYVSPPLRLPPGSRFRSVFWTWYRAQVPSDTAPFAMTFPLPTDYAEIEIVDPSGTSYPSGWTAALARSSQAPGWTRDLQQWVLPAAAPDAFRLRVSFLRATPLPANTPILDSPVLDDLTVLYLPPGPAVAEWEEKPGGGG